MGGPGCDADVDPLTGAVSANRRDRGPRAADLAALEHALRLAERWDAQVVAATVGPGEADAMLRDALAVGAAQALRVELASRTAGPRPAVLVGGGQESAAALAAALIRQHYGVPDLVLCGDRPADRATGSFPAFLAAALGAEQVLGCRAAGAGDDGVRCGCTAASTAAAARCCSCGGLPWCRSRRPGVRLRRAGLPATLAKANTPITVAGTPAAAPRIRVLGAHPYRPRPRELPEPSGTALRRTLELTGALVQRTPPTVVGPLSPGQAADELLGYLRRHGYLVESDPG